jgi:tyrosine-protein phosphatase SIW14
VIIIIKKLLILFLIVQSTAFAETRLRPNEWATKIIGSGLENFYHLDKNVFRSEQPNRKTFSQVEKFGIKEVLNLRQYHTDNGEAENTQLVLHHVKMNAANVTYPQIFKALQTIKNAKGPILIHCWHGSDRTGVVSASYRVIFQNWPKAQAIDEMKHGGYGYHQKFYPVLIQIIEGLDVKSFQKKLGLNNESL